MARLKVKYTEEIAPSLMKKFQYKSVMQIPTLDKIIVNVGCGESKNNAKEIESHYIENVIDSKECSSDDEIKWELRTAANIWCEQCRLYFCVLILHVSRR